MQENDELIILSEEEFFEQFATEPIEENDILALKQGTEKEVISLCQKMGEFYDNLNLQRISTGKLQQFLVENGLKTKKDIYLYLLYREESMVVQEEVITSLQKILTSFYRIKQRVDVQSRAQSVSLLDGNMVQNVSFHYILGYCHYKLHKGYVTQNLLESHECLRKQCPFLERFEERKYWKKKEQIKALKKEERQREIAEKNQLESYKLVAESYIKEQNYKLLITSIIKDNDGFLVYFVTDKNLNEETKYCDVSNFLRRKFNKKFIMRKVSKSSSEYATIKDFEKYIK